MDSRLLRFFFRVLLLPVCVLWLANAHAQLEECPEIVPPEEIEAGIRATGWTVAQGKTPEPFTVEVLGVLRDGIALGHDMIIVEIGDEPGSTMIERAGGIWAGMSGSPVYVDDRLLGAIAWTFSTGPSRVGGVTPAADMLDVLSLPQEVEARATRVMVPEALRPLLAQRAGLTQSQVTSLQALPLAFGVSGLNAQGRAMVQNALERAGIAAIVTPASSTARQQGAIVARPVPGGNFAGLLSLGDLSAGGVGTTTYVCGDRALAFGHSLRLMGATSLSTNDAEALTIVTDPTTGPFKLANFGSTFGVLDQDRSVAIAATLGTPPPLIRIASFVEAPDIERSRTGVSWTPASQFAPDVAFLHLLTNVLAVFDEQGDGRSRVRWRIAGRRANGDEWSFRRTNRYASRSDISFPVAVDVLNKLAAIERNAFEDATFKRIKVKAKVWSEFQTYQVDSFEVSRNGEPASGPDAVDVRPGDELVVAVTLRSEDGALREADLALRVPADITGQASISVFGGGSAPIVSDDCLFNHSECETSSGDSFQDLLDDIADTPRNNILYAVLESGSSDESGHSIASRRFSRVVDGSGQGSIKVLP